MKKSSWLFTFVIGVMSFFSLTSTTYGAESTANTAKGVVEFVPNSDPTNPVDPENPDPNKPVQPIDPTNPGGKPNEGTAGPLSIDYASSFDFGKNKISNQDQIYYANAQRYSDGHSDTANYVQVTDNRGNNAGWQLTVKQTNQLTATSPTLNKILTGAQITIEEPHVASVAKSKAPVAAAKITLNPSGSESMVMSAKVESGSGTWVDYWGKVEKTTVSNENNQKEAVNITKAVSLSVPGITPKDAVKYQTNLIWTLSDTPAN